MSLDRNRFVAAAMLTLVACLAVGVVQHEYSNEPSVRVTSSSHTQETGSDDTGWG